MVRHVMFEQPTMNPLGSYVRGRVEALCDVPSSIDYFVAVSRVWKEYAALRGTTEDTRSAEQNLLLKSFLWHFQSEVYNETSKWPSKEAIWTAVGQTFFGTMEYPESWITETQCPEPPVPVPNQPQHSVSQTGAQKATETAHPLTKVFYQQYVKACQASGLKVLSQKYLAEKMADGGLDSELRNGYRVTHLKTLLDFTGSSKERFSQAQFNRIEQTAAPVSISSETEGPQSVVEVPSVGEPSQGQVPFLHLTPKMKDPLTARISVAFPLVSENLPLLQQLVQLGATVNLTVA